MFSMLQLFPLSLLQISILLIIYKIGMLCYKITNNIPDLIIHRSPVEIYLKRWHVVPRNRFFNVYLHHFHQSDLDEALHDHPWLFNMSILLNGRYKEYVPENLEEWFPKDNATRPSRSTKFIERSRFIPILRIGQTIHRIELNRDSSGNLIKIWTLFITGPVIGSWGFYCQNKKVDHDDFLLRDSDSKGTMYNIGTGCNSHDKND